MRFLFVHYSLRNRPFPTEEDLASIDEEALKAKEEAEKDKDEEEDIWVGEIQLGNANTISSKKCVKHENY